MTPQTCWKQIFRNTIFLIVIICLSLPPKAYATALDITTHIQPKFSIPTLFSGTPPTYDTWQFSTLGISGSLSLNFLVSDLPMTLGIVLGYGHASRSIYPSHIITKDFQTQSLGIRCVFFLYPEQYPIHEIGISLNRGHVSYYVPYMESIDFTEVEIYIARGFGKHFQDIQPLVYFLSVGYVQRTYMQGISVGIGILVRFQKGSTL